MNNNTLTTDITFWDKQFISLLRFLYKTQQRDKSLYTLYSSFIPIENITQKSSPIMTFKLTPEAFEKLDDIQKKEKWKEIKTNFSNKKFSSPESHALCELTERFKLNENQIKLTIFFFLYDRYATFAEYFNALKETLQLSLLELFSSLSRNILIEEIRETGYLLKCGILDTECSPNITFNRYNTTVSLSQYISYYLDDTNNKPLTSFFLETFEHAELPISAFNLAPETISSAISTLKKEGPGLVLFYGEPGTGKTELAKTIVLEAGLKPSFLKYDSQCTRTLSKLFTAAKLINPNTDVLIIDEAEVLLFTGSIYENLGSPNPLKGLINQFLDDYSKKMILIVNNINNISSSTLRRIYVTIAFKQFTYRQRQRIWNTINEKTPLFSPEEQKKLSLEFPANPARIRQVYEICNSLVASGTSQNLILGTARDMLGRSAELLNDIPFEHKIKTEKIDPMLLNLTSPVSSILDQIKKWYSSFLANPEGLNLLFYGLPGTGKTAFARYIADSLGLPPVIKRASDLFGSYVGQTEANIRDAFDEAKDCALIIDEADSFLADRSSAVRSWERTQVNEFLTRMETFQGLFIATTNFNSILDSASLRRFQYKIEFLPPNAEQRIQLANHFFPLHDWSEKNLKLLYKLENITPGDFKTVSRQMMYLENVESEMILEELKKECGWKEKERIGFNY
jgi:transitional endoplasmic reticulum ATPase